MGIANLLLLFFIAFLMGYIWASYTLVTKETTDFVVFDGDEEIQKFHESCFNGMRKGIE
jgi:hypothetical protein|tara:strand:- start:1040 stop:1216 length:177 start_codon:yes stop_codon:yes gene_type:complete